MQFTTGTYSQMDSYGRGESISPLEPLPTDERGDVIIPDEALNFTAKDLGTTTNPMGNTLDSMKSRIREGTSKIEFSFMGTHKGNSQNPTPESFGTLERTDMRELAKINDMKTSTHAAVHANALSGFSERGFNDAARGEVMHEIKRAIQFAGEATRGGAIVFHIHEWQRPLTQIQDKKGAKFGAYDEEDLFGQTFAVDKRTGEMVADLNKKKEIYRPVYITAKDQGLTGKKDRNGNILSADDWVDFQGNKINREDKPERLFDRQPKFEENSTNFKVEKLTYDDIQRETQKHNQEHPNDIRTPVEMVAILEMERRVLAAKAGSLFHARGYEEDKKYRDKLVEEHELYLKLKNSLKEDEQWKLKQFQSKFNLRPDDGETLEQAYDKRIKQIENSMRHTHEASSAQDAQAKEFEARITNIQSAEKYGVAKAADTIAKSAIYAMKTYEQNKDKYGLKEALYVAPENWNTKHYGSHPDEYRKVIDESRNRMIDLLMSTQGKSKAEAEELSKKHIKGTLDIGHLNTFREHFKGNPKDFEKWMLDQAEDLVKKGYVGHIHMSDNYGFDDEHITPGQGNVPVKEFLKRMEKLGMKDVVIETGSFNISSAVPDTLSYINSPIYGTGQRIRFNNMRNQHFGYNAPGFFIAGAYSPSNDWKPWTDIPLE